MWSIYKAGLAFTHSFTSDGCTLHRAKARPFYIEEPEFLRHTQWPYLLPTLGQKLLTYLRQIVLVEFFI